MATSFARAPAQPFAPSTSQRRGEDRPTKRKERRTDIWSNLLRQTRQAQARNRSNAVAQRQLIVCGGSSNDQRQFLSFLARPPPPQPLNRNRDQREQKPKGQLTLSNRYAYGYGHLSLYSPPQGGPGGSNFGSEAEEAARLEIHTVSEPDEAYQPVLRRLLAAKEQGNGELDDSEGNDGSAQNIEAGNGQGPAVAILLSWREPWRFLQQLREWLHLLGRSALPPSAPADDAMDVLKEAGISVTLIVQHVEAQQGLEREGWSEETFDYVCQILRTAILPLHPLSSLIFTTSSLAPQPLGSALSENQKVIYQSLGLDLTVLSPRVENTSTPTKKEDLLPRHNVVDRMNIVVPPAWDSVGKIRLVSESFSPEEVLVSWQHDLTELVRLDARKLQQAEPTVASDDKQTNSGLERRQQAEEVFEIASSPVEPEDLPVSPAMEKPSAIRTYENTVHDPQALKRPKPPTIQVKSRPDQDFLREMKTELDALVAKDKERGADLPRMGSGIVNGKIIGTPSGESTGALNQLGDVSFNVGGVSYNTVSAEAAIKSLKRTAQTNDSSTTPSPLSNRIVTPRPPRREDRDITPTAHTATTPSTSKSDFPSEDLEKYFASLAKKSGGESRSGTPSRTSR